MMPDREKIINAFVLCRVNEGCSTNCPYWDNSADIKGCTQKLATDVYSLLKEQRAEIEQLRNDANARRCKDCKHRPKEPDWERFENGGDIEFPDGKCPCQCSSDRYCSWYPEDDWFCANFDPSDEAVLEAFAHGG